MTSDEGKKNILMSAVTSTSANSPVLKLPVSKHKTEQSNADKEPASNFKGMLDAGRKADRVVGNILVKENAVKSSFVLLESEHDDFKVICAIKKIKMGTLIREAIVAFIAENNELLKR